MPKPKKIIEGKNVDHEKEPMMEKLIDGFILHNENRALYIDHYVDESIPVMTRLDTLYVAKLDHLAERWRTTRSNVVGQMLEEMIRLVTRKVYAEKTDEEYKKFEDELTAKYREKGKVGKKKKGKQ
jgi:predicted transcriptional regulator